MIVKETPETKLARFNNRLPALYLAVCRVAVASDIGLEWIEPMKHKPGLPVEQAEVAA